MNKEIKARWVEALRSGKYEQGTASLRKDDRFCCLGVLCDLFNKDLWQKMENGVEKYQDYLLLPSRDVVNWAGLEENNPEVKHRGCSSNLSALNDSGESFQVIANLIEEQL